MRILSPFKDYYDYISHQFGADPDCTYIRKRLTADQYQIEWENREVRGFNDTLNNEARANGYELSFIIAGPLFFTMIQKHTTVGDKFVSSPLVVLGEEHHKLLKLDWARELEFPTIPKKEAREAFIREVGAPVFRVKGWDYDWRKKKSILRVYEEVPILKDTNIPSTVSAQTMWQGIYSTLTSVLRHNPDKAPPVQLGNDDRIHAAGFDVKLSFRHPINPRKL